MPGEEMSYFGPVSEAARGGHGNPAFELLVGLTVLSITWFGYSRRDAAKPVTIWAALGVSAVCAYFIYSGVAGFLTR